VINHALLLANAGRDDQLLPPFRHLVIDEAHRLEEVATSHFGHTLSVRDLRDHLEALGGAERHGNPGLARRLQDSGGPASALALTAPMAVAGQELAGAAAAARALVPDLGDALRAFVREQEQGGNTELRSLSSGARAQPAWEAVEQQSLELDTALSLVARRVDDVLDGLAALGVDELPPHVGELRVDALRGGESVSQVRAVLDGAVLRPTRDDISWVSLGNGDVRLASAPLSVAGKLEEDVLGSRRSVTVTSATLSAGDEFDYTLGGIGLEGAQTLTVGSPFDFRRAVLILLVDDLPEPGMPGYDAGLHEALEGAATGAGGRTLALFTSHRALRNAAGALRDTLGDHGIAIAAQGIDGSPGRVVNMLAGEPRTVVLGTAALWEGVDVPGEALSQIVVARLPFPVPADPIHAGRSELYEDPFEEHALPHAVLRFRQGFGRLIRTSQDRGVFVVADSRVVRRRYGEHFVAALPDCEVRTVRASEIHDNVTRWLRK
jgi:DNA polymerase-3 subunit epsilon/ATP-dependent DNA helicase DinG